MNRSGSLEMMVNSRSSVYTIVGTPQGGSISPLLANVMLNELDKELEARGLNFVRYADDLIIMVGSRQAAERVMKSVTRFIEERLGLKVNAEKSKAQMKKLTCRSWGVSNAYKVGKLNQLIRGWINYFKIGSMKKLCARLDQQIRYRIRMCVWKHWKTPKNRAKNLMKLDVPRWAAYEIAYSGARIVRMCHNGWVNKAISNKRLANFGLISMLDYYTARCVTC